MRPFKSVRPGALPVPSRDRRSLPMVRRRISRMGAGISIFIRPLFRQAKCAAPLCDNEARDGDMRSECTPRLAILILAGASASWAGDPISGKAIFETRCHGCHAALPYIGRVGEAN